MTLWINFLLESDLLNHQYDASYSTGPFKLQTSFDVQKTCVDCLSMYFSLSDITILVPSVKRLLPQLLQVIQQNILRHFLGNQMRNIVPGFLIQRSGEEQSSYQFWLSTTAVKLLLMISKPHAVICMVRIRIIMKE